MIIKTLPGFLALALCGQALAQTPLVTNMPARKNTSLNGRWQYIIDPYETGFQDYRHVEHRESDREAYWNSDVPDNKTDRKEFGYTDRYTLQVPGDWNSQQAKFLYYEGSVWYRKTFDYRKSAPDNRVFLYFGAVNYRADVFLNGKKLGTHIGGFTPFNFEVPDSILKTRGNFLVVRVDNQRSTEEVPTDNTDWWNYGGITREVKIVELPPVFIRDYSLQLQKPAPGASAAGGSLVITGWVASSGQPAGEAVVEIPELHLRQSFAFNGDTAQVRLEAPALKLWSPEQPKRYTVRIGITGDAVEDKIGFRTIEVAGKKILLNGAPVFLRGICIHAEIPQQQRRAWSRQDALQLLGWAKELHCNMVRLAHYPHDENMTRMADSLGLLVWSEIPVYWTIDFGSAEVLEKARAQLKEMITRDRNRASIIIWSVGNETPVSPTRTNFMHTLINTARALDSSRLVTAAMEVGYNKGKNRVSDPLGAYTDLIAVNEYLGWYGGLPSACRTAQWETVYDKPLFFSETGAEALGGYHADSLTRWSEEYQQWYYREQVAMMQRMPDNYIGLSPWILVDFRSPKRNNPRYQNGWNNKGLIDHQGRKKKAFFVLENYYRKMQAYFPPPPSR